MAVHQCPKCDLRFADLAEVKSHLVEDHGVDPEDFEGHFGVGVHVPVHREVPDPVRAVRADHGGR